MSYAPYNAITGKRYEGEVNIRTLTLKAVELETEDPRWLTFLQASERGYKVKKGSHGTNIRYMRFDEQSDESGKKIRKMLYRTYRVFNATQIEGIPRLSAQD